MTKTTEAAANYIWRICRENRHSLDSERWCKRIEEIIQGLPGDEEEEASRFAAKKFTIKEFCAIIDSKETNTAIAETFDVGEKTVRKIRSLRNA